MPNITEIKGRYLKNVLFLSIVVFSGFFCLFVCLFLRKIFKCDLKTSSSLNKLS